VKLFGGNKIGNLTFWLPLVCHGHSRPWKMRSSKMQVGQEGWDVPLHVSLLQSLPTADLCNCCVTSSSSCAVVFEFLCLPVPLLAFLIADSTVVNYSLSRHCRLGPGVYDVLSSTRPNEFVWSVSSQDCSKLFCSEE